MRWSELIIIYLAVGAPVGVSYALRPQAVDHAGRRAWGASVLTALLWPWAVARWLRHKAFAWQLLAKTRKTSPSESDALTVAYLSAVRTLAEVTHTLQTHNSALAVEDLWQKARTTLEVYAGLTRAVREIDETAPAGPRALALYGVAGYAGNELEIAGRCVQRRNANRLRLHQSQAREDFLTMWPSLEQAVAATLREVAGNHSAAQNVRKIWHDFTECVRRLCVALGDDAAALAATRWKAGERPEMETLSAPAVGKNLPPQNGGTECLPLKDLPFLNLPERTSRLG